ncbi:MAG: hypothetical protein SGPRY_002230, partial [Prymnesium sp.]
MKASSRGAPALPIARVERVLCEGLSLVGAEGRLQPEEEGGEQLLDKETRVVLIAATPEERRGEELSEPGEKLDNLRLPEQVCAGLGKGVLIKRIE